MKDTSVENRLAVCSWSLQPGSPGELVAKVKETGLSRVQLALDPLRESPDIWRGAPAVLEKHGIQIVSGMFGCVGEDYSTLESIRRTGGIAPEETWEQNLAHIAAAAVMANRLGLRLVTFHAGFLPHDPADPGFERMLGRLRKVADVFESEQVELGLETGQETAAVLLKSLERLDRAAVGVNFDPANMILYDKGDPVAAVEMLGPWIRQVHIKDALRTREPGTWGQEVAVGAGEVNWPAFFAALKHQGFAGDLVIEREAGGQRVTDIRTARDFVLQTLV